MTSDISLLAKQTVSSRYEILDEPREGGFAYVYRAYDTHLNRPVALKVLKPERITEERWRTGIHTEAQRWAQIPSHPNVVYLIDHGTDQIHQVDYLTMEWVEGPNLDEWRGGSSLIKEIESLLKIAVECCEGVNIVHQRGLVHGDITPRNILLAKQNGHWVPKLTDFGLAWNATDGRPDKIGGTLKYAAPEQLEADGLVDLWTDVYALGTALFYLFSGDYYLGEIAGGEADWRDAIRNKSALSLQSVLGACNSDLDQLLADMLHKDPNQRPEIREVLDRFGSIQRYYAQPSRAGSTPQAVEIQRIEETTELELQIVKSAYDPIYDRVGSHLQDHPVLGPEWQWVNDTETLVSALVEIGTEYDCYLFNDGEGQNSGERRIIIRLATDTDNPNNHAYFQPIGKTLELVCVQKPRQRYLLVLRVSCVGIEDGQRKRHALAARIRFASRATGTRDKSGLNPEVIKRIAALPQGLEPDAEVQQRLEHWETYLNVWERVAKEKEYVISYVAWERDPHNSDVIMFQLRGEIPWNLIENSRRGGESIFLRRYHEEYDPIDRLLAAGSTDEWGTYEDIRPAIGTVERIYQDRRVILIQLDEDFMERYWDEEDNLPRIDTEGYLAYVSTGDLAQIRQQRIVLKRLAEGDTVNWHLNQFIFDAGRAGYPDADGINLRRDQLLLPDLNADQLKAVEGALNAPDLYLIQGPPGTGKTTVIAELCYQFTKRGQRVLVSSQSNLAVDNALSRLAHHPHILALRIGREKSVEPEGEPFTEEQVVGTWFERTASDCEHQLQIRHQRLEHFMRLFTDLGRLEQYAEILHEYQNTLPHLIQAHLQALDELNEAEKHLGHLERQKEELPELYSLLHRSAEAIRTSSIPVFESLRYWRSEIIDLVAESEYQEYLSSLVDAINLLAWLGVDTDAITGSILLPDERNLLKRLCTGDDEAKLWSHRPTAILYIGGVLRGTVDEHEPGFFNLKALLDGLDTHLQHYLGLQTEQAQVSSLITMIDLQVRLSDAIDILTGLLHHSGDYRQTEVRCAELHRQITHFDNAIAEIQTERAAIQDILSRKEAISQAIKQIQLSLQSLSVARTNLAKESQRVKAAREKAERVADSITLVEQNILRQERVVNECRQIYSNPQSYLAALRTWIGEKQSDRIDGLLSQSLVEAIKCHNWQGVAPVFERLTQLADQALAAYQKVLPAKYQENIQIDRADSSLDMYQEVSQLFESRNNSRYPRDEALVCQQFIDICKTHLQVLREASGLRAGRKFEQGKRELEYLHILRRFFHKKHQDHAQHNATLLARSDNLISELRKIVQPIIEQEQEKLGGLQNELDLARQRNGGEELHTIEAQYQQVVVQAQEQTTAVLQQLRILNDLTKQTFGDSLLHAVNAIDWTNPGFSQFKKGFEECRTELSTFWSEQVTQFENLQQRVLRLENDRRVAQSELEIALQQQIRSQQQAQNDSRFLLNLFENSASIASITEWSANLRSTCARLEEDFGLAEYSAALRDLQEEADTLNIWLEAEIATIVNASDLETVEKAVLERLLAERSNMLRELEVAIQEQIETTQEGVLNGSPSTVLSAENATAWQMFVAETIALLDDRDRVIAKFNAFDLLGALETRIHERQEELFNACEKAVLNRRNCEQKTALAKNQADEYQKQYRIEHDWWETLHAAIPQHLLEDWTNLETIHDIDYVQIILERACTTEWEKELTHQTSLVHRTEPLVRDWIERLRGSDERDANALRDLYVKNANVLGVTCGQVPRLTKRNPALNFDVVIVDEVSKATPPELLLPMAIGRKIILVGDHKQLPPMVQDNSLQQVAEELDISQDELGHFKQSLFGNLYNSSPQVLRHMLTEQYRMRPAIMRAINQFYEYQLTGGHQRAHNLPVANLDNDTALAWVATPRDETYFEEQIGFSYSNPKEVEIIEQLLEQMNTAWQPRVDTGESPKEVGIITFYMAQFRLFRKRAWGSRFGALHIRMGTVDRFQGMERDVVIVSLVRNNPYRNIGFAKEPERINVAFSRARELLVIVGCQQLFAQSARNAYEATAAYAEISKIVQREGKVIHVSELH